MVPVTRTNEEICEEHTDTSASFFHVTLSALQPPVYCFIYLYHSAAKHRESPRSPRGSNKYCASFQTSIMQQCSSRVLPHRKVSLSLSTVRSACIILAVENNGRAFNDSAQDGSVYPPFSAHLNVQSILLRVFRASSKWLTRKIALFLVHQLSVVFALRSFCMFTATKFAFLFFRH